MPALMNPLHDSNSLKSYVENNVSAVWNFYYGGTHIHISLFEGRVFSAFNMLSGHSMPIIKVPDLDDIRACSSFIENHKNLC